MPLSSSLESPAGSMLLQLALRHAVHVDCLRQGSIPPALGNIRIDQTNQKKTNYSSEGTKVLEFGGSLNQQEVFGRFLSQ